MYTLNNLKLNLKYPENSDKDKKKYLIIYEIRNNINNTNTAVLLNSYCIIQDNLIKFFMYIFHSVNYFFLLFNSFMISYIFILLYDK